MGRLSFVFRRPWRRRGSSLWCFGVVCRPKGGVRSRKILGGRKAWKGWLFSISFRLLIIEPGHGWRN